MQKFLSDIIECFESDPLMSKKVKSEAFFNICKANFKIILPKFERITNSKTDHKIDREIDSFFQDLLVKEQGDRVVNDFFYVNRYKIYKK